MIDARKRIPLSTSNIGNSNKLAGQACFVADHAALDFLNTAAMVDGELRDLIADDSAVLRWLERAGLSTPGAAKVCRRHPGRLASCARGLRDAFRAGLLCRKEKRVADVTALNRLLGRKGAFSRIDWRKGHLPRHVHLWRVASPEDLLAPLAQSMADLLVDADFALVRRCENPECVLWFYDRTKAHRRRWCSMAVCGNRMKVAAFRARQRGA
jgi:predicted RNA-binding Zn ribbon-like protein